MNEEALLQWMDERIADGEDATVYEFIREVLDRSHGDRELAESAQARISEHEETIRRLTDDNNRLKSHNYDLLMRIPDDHNDGDGEVIENVEEDGEIYHIDNLFVDPDEGKDDV